jgi:hypothetical protein
LKIQQANNGSAILSSGEKFLNGFPKIITVPITEVEIKYTITSLKNKKLSGYDGLSNKILKYVVNLLADLLLIFSVLL